MKFFQTFFGLINCSGYPILPLSYPSSFPLTLSSNNPSLLPTTTTSSNLWPYLFVVHPGTSSYAERYQSKITSIRSSDGVQKCRHTSSRNYQETHPFCRAAGIHKCIFSSSFSVAKDHLLNI